MAALLLVAVSVGLSNFAAAISLGIAGVDARTRLRVGLVFGAFEAGMPVIGLLVGDHLAGQLGHAGRWISGALLIGVGGYGLIRSWHATEPAEPADPADSTESARPVSQPGPDAGAGAGAGSLPRLLVSGLALSLDNLVVGFALGTYQIGILAGALVIGMVSVALSLAGLEIGRHLGSWTGRPGQVNRRGDMLSGAILISVGAVIATGALA